MQFRCPVIAVSVLFRHSQFSASGKMKPELIPRFSCMFLTSAAKHTAWPFTRDSLHPLACQVLRPAQHLVPR